MKVEIRISQLIAKILLNNEAWSKSDSVLQGIIKSDITFYQSIKVF